MTVSNCTVFKDVREERFERQCETWSIVGDKGYISHSTVFLSFSQLRQRQGPPNRTRYFASDL